MTIPSITPYSGTLPQRSDPANFPTNADDFVAWQEGTLAPELAATVTAINTTVATMSAIAAGGAMTLPYTFSSTTTDADPGAGYLRLDNATQNAATVIRMDHAGSDGSGYTDVINSFDDSTSAVKGLILLQKLADATKWLLFSVASLASPSGYKNVTVVAVASSATSPFSNGDALVLKFSRTGDAGATGSTGPAGSAGSPVLLAVLTPSVGVNVDFLSTFTSTYDNYLIVGNGITFGTDEGLSLRLAVAGAADTGSNYLSTSYDSIEQTTTATSVQIPAAATIRSAGKGCNFTIRVLNANDTARHKQIACEITWNSTVAGPGYTTTQKSAAYLAANAVTGFRLFTTLGGNFAATGKVRVYGYSNT